MGRSAEGFGHEAFQFIDELDGLFGSDPWPYGLEANRVTLETLMQFLVEQRLSPKTTAIDDLFAPIVTANE